MMAEQPFEPESDSWEQLKQAFVARSQRSNPPASAAELWRLFANDRWFQQQLEARARRALLARVGRLDWLGDVKHEALLSLARQLAKTPDLHVDLETVDRTFPAWIITIVDRACGDAIRWLRRLERLERVDLEKIADLRDKQSTDARIDISLAIDAQEEPYRTLLWLSAKGCSIQEIAQQRGLTYWETYRRLRTGLARLERRLASYQQPRSLFQRSVSPVSSSSTMTR